PDVRAALLRVTAADHRVGAAIAAQYPSLNLSASTGFQSPDLLELFEYWVWNLAANLVAPLFDGGRRSAEVDRSRAVLEDLVLAYGQAALTAVTEVESALVQESRQRQHVERLDEQLKLARLAFGETEVRYANGLSTYLEVLNAQRALQQSEQSMLQAQRQLLSFRVQLHRALGGTWMNAATTTEPNNDRGTP
ncbi:MAG TPA: TolC family protein, partial [Myxococcota bacterium]|nr:TolC family protein [Myxococcota bacterium]